MSGVATVMIVEDEFAIADLLEMVLVDEGYRVVTAANGRQALQRLEDGPAPDLIISDLMMPVLDGAAMLRALRSSAAHGKIPCIVMSSVPESSVRALVDVYAGFVRKPFRLAAMTRLVARVLADRPGVDASG